MRMRKKKNLLPRLERVSEFQEKDPYARRGDWRSWKPDCTALYLEIGCGKGTFTVETAAAHPDVLFVAVEKVADCILLAMEKAQAKHLTNVVFVCDDAARLGEMFAPGEVNRLYINFCDPWPSKRHAKRRLTYEDFLKSYRAILPMGGEIHFKTDNRPLFDFSLTQFPRAGYTLSEVTNDLHADDPNVIMTDYEARFAKEGARINRCVGTVTELPEQLGEEPELGLLHYLPEDLEHLEYTPYGMADVIEQEILRRKSEARKAAKQAAQG